ncbi:MAG: hypothetical protein IJH12_07710 [Clostridia bacterium]|nr:hypothetical protein [Clostridia bacterium]
MNKKIKIFHITSAIIVALLGTLLHFTYNLSGNNNLVALFSSVNESTWEHLKLLFFPMLLTSIAGYLFLFKSLNGYWCARAIGISISLIFTVVFFYTYSGILGKNIAFIDIISFFFSIILGEISSYTLMRNNIPCIEKYAILFLIILTVSFVIFTFNPPNIGLFIDPTKMGI